MREVLLALCALIALTGCTTGMTSKPDPSLAVVQDVVSPDIMARVAEMRLGSPFSL